MQIYSIILNIQNIIRLFIGKSLNFLQINNFFIKIISLTHISTI